VGLATLILLRRFENGGAWVLLSMMLSWLADTAAYFSGRAFGRHKLYEKVSPKKTVEGAIGGLFGSTGGALLAHFWYLPELSWVGAVALGIVAGGLGQAGDLAESMIKRSTGVKDSGWIIPGHGGILDRIDALIFTAPVTWAYVTWLHPALP
jgi:phosphatidate cytidylyltransferase